MRLVAQILDRMPGIRKSQTKFLAILFRTVLALSGRVNFANLSRYSSLCEKTYSRNFRRSFDFTGFNAFAVEYVYNPSHQYILAGDTTPIPKSGERMKTTRSSFSCHNWSRYLRNDSLSPFPATWPWMDTMPKPALCMEHWP